MTQLASLKGVGHYWYWQAACAGLQWQWRQLRLLRQLAG